DMVHWRQLKHALLPYRVDGKSGTIFSGTVVVDHNNSLRVQQGDASTLCAFFTFACQPRFYQAMAYSTDRGGSWTYWNQGRPVVENQGFDQGERDPKVFWHEASQRWVMVLWVQMNPGRVRFFTSKNLTDWTFASDLMRDWAFECMDLVFLPVDGDPARTKAVLYDASFDYEVGEFDGQRFHTESGPYHAGGGNFYAAQTFNNQPENRAVQIGWMRGGPNPSAAYGLPYNGQMSFPCELTLHEHKDGLRLRAWPIKELASLITETTRKDDTRLASGENLLEGVANLDLVDLQIDFEPGDSEELIFSLAGAKLRYLCKERTLRVDAADDAGKPQEITAISGVSVKNGMVRLRILVDRLSIESYANGGEQFHASYRAPNAKNSGASITPGGGEAVVRSLVLNKLRSAWRASSAAAHRPAFTGETPLSD
ncbi:MAG: glycoside hydrolase family 32 protein, partial [Planctomycetales bacterium]|nr:glycoside hydrolase family 32 protein [Planctomycetales bacterium]